MLRSLVVNGCAAIGLILFVACGAPDPKGSDSKGREPKADDAEPATNDEEINTDKAGPRCGDGKCDTGETCKSCDKDCGACAVCALAAACSTITETPGSLTPTTKLDVKMVAMSREEILQQLIADADNGSPGLSLLAAAVNGKEEPGELRSITTLRSYFATRPSTLAILRRELARPSLVAAIHRAPPAATLMNLPPPSMRTMDANANTADGGAGADGGAAVCDPPKLRIRVSRVTVHEEDDDVANDIVYCNVATESQGGSEMRITPKTPNLDEGRSHEFAGSAGIFWGLEGPRDSVSDLTIRYDCYEEDAPNGYGQFVQKAVELLKKEGGKYVRWKDGYGWIGTAIDLVTKYLPAILALDSDDHLFVATQTIRRADQLALANGATWTIRKKGTHLFSDWDWSIKVDAWGCVDNGKVSP